MSTARDFMEEVRSGFKNEALDLLAELDLSLLEMESKPGELAAVHRVFRAIHTIKGSGGMAGYARLARFAHTLEEVFEQARAGLLPVTPELVDGGLKACDVLRLILENPGATEIVGEEEVSQALTRLLATAPASSTREAGPGEASRRERAAYEIVLKPKREMFYSGVDPMTLLDELRELGQAHITTHVDEVPELRSMQPEYCYLWWEILLVAEISLRALQDVFVFVESDCEIHLRLLEDQEGAVALLGSIPADTLALFQQECEEQLEQVERATLELEKHREAGEDLAALFRGIHNIKGNANALLGQIKGARLIPSHPLQLLHQVAHGLESLLDPFRAAATPVTQEAVETSFETCDAIRGLLAGLTHRPSGAGAASVSSRLLGRLGVQADFGSGTDTVDQRRTAFLNTTSQWVDVIADCLDRIERNGGASGPALETYLRGVRTLSAAARYQSHPELEEPLARQLTILDAALREGAVLASAQRLELGRAFESVCSILQRLAKAREAEASAEPARDSRAAERVLPEERTTAASATIRIDQEKLDRLMRVAGQLLVARGVFPLLVQKLREGADGALVVKELKDAGSNILRLTDELQASVMSIRMLPAKAVFQKFPRLVRDLARSLGKDVRLVMEGESVELDKTILEQIADPLIHAIRNAVDHGLEPPEERLAQGKEARGELKLRAANEAGGVIMEVSDDGRGLDAEALKRKAIKQGLVTAEAAAAMSEAAAFQLIFLPGLSTAEAVTNVSGRGVGMDVVRSNVHNLQGAVEIHSKRGRGTTVRMKLPTSLMISKGILLEAGAQEYILPLASIRDMVKMPREQAREYRDLQLAHVRGNVYPIFMLAETLGLRPAEKPELSVAIVEAGRLRYGLGVDRFVSEVEVLVKPLTGGLEHCREFQGAAIMGDGRIVLVLNALECHGLDRTACA